MPARNIFIHIGQPKTGTTALQQFFKENRKELDQSGLSYGKGCHLLPNLWQPESDNYKKSIKAWKRLSLQAQHTDKALLISNEGLSSDLRTDPERVQELKKFFKASPIKLILYLRRQDLHLESFYLQQIRGKKHTVPFGLTAMDEIIHPDYYDYAATIRFLEEHFGRENLILRVYDWNTFFGGNIAKDFIHAIGMDWNEEYRLPASNINVSIDARLKDLLLTANASIPETGGQLREFKELIDTVEDSHFLTKEKKLLTVQERTDFMKYWEKGNSWIANRYFNRSELFDTSSVNTLGEPKRIREKDLYMVLLHLNTAWTQGVGAIPAPLYNKLKITHLDVKSTHGSLIQKQVLKIQIYLLWGMNMIMGLTIPRSWLTQTMEKTIMRYIRKHLHYSQGKRKTDG